MVFCLDKQSNNQTLNIKTDFEKYIICDVSITLMSHVSATSSRSCANDVLGVFTFLSINCVLFNQFS